MLLILDRIREAIPDFNERPLTLEDAARFCESNGIYVVDDRRRRHGRLQLYKDYVFLLINPGLNPAWRHWVIWHEIGHFLLHDPATSNFSHAMRRRNEAEANFVAAVALMPTSLLRASTAAEIASETGYPPELMAIRMKIYEKENI